MNFILETMFAGFLSAIGWWGANQYIIDPHLKKPNIEQQQQQEQPKKEELKQENKNE